MGLLNTLNQDGSVHALGGNNTTPIAGAPTPPVNPGTLETSTLHNQYSINGVPSMTDMYFQSTLPSPGLPSLDLDLEGATPPKYLDNPPG